MKMLNRDLIYQMKKNYDIHKPECRIKKEVRSDHSSTMTQTGKVYVYAGEAKYEVYRDQDILPVSIFESMRYGGWHEWREQDI